MCVCVHGRREKREREREKQTAAAVDKLDSDERAHKNEVEKSSGVAHVHFSEGVHTCVFARTLLLLFFFIYQEVLLIFFTFCILEGEVRHPQERL
jgi:hypothetical protein